MIYGLARRVASGRKPPPRRVVSLAPRKGRLQQRPRHRPTYAGTTTKEQKDFPGHGIPIRRTLSGAKTSNDRSSGLQRKASDLTTLAALREPSHLRTMSQGARASKPERNIIVLSPEDRASVLAKLSPTLQLHIKNGLLVDQVAFPRCVALERPWPELQESLNSLIEYQLRQPKKKNESQYLLQARRQSLLANAKWLRRESFEESSLTRSKRQEKMIKGRLHTLIRWRDLYMLKIKEYRLARGNTVGARRRLEQLEVLVQETTRSIEHLQSAIGTGSLEPDDKSPLIGPDDDHSKRISHDVEAPVQLNPGSLSDSLGSLSDSLVYHLSRELLDSLNEAAFEFGQQQAPATMKENYWNSPETIDLQVFVSSFSLYPFLFRRFLKYENNFLRLRSFRNQYAHGSGGMTAGDILLALQNFGAVAVLLQSPELTVKVKQYKTLLEEFSVNQMQHTKHASTLIKQIRDQSKAKLERLQAEAEGGGDAPQDAMLHLVAYQTATIEEAWMLTKQHLRELNERNISLFVWESQIRRIVGKMGPDATAVLSKFQEEKKSCPPSVGNDQDTKEIFASLTQRLSEALDKSTDEVIRADNTVTTPGTGANGLTAEMLKLMPSAREGSTEIERRQAKRQWRQLAWLGRKGI